MTICSNIQSATVDWIKMIKRVEDTVLEFAISKILYPWRNPIAYFNSFAVETNDCATRRGSYELQNTFYESA